jgi:hypothetical protein
MAALPTLLGRKSWLGAADPPDIAGNTVGNDQAVADLDDAVGGFGQFRRVGDDDDGMAVLVHLPQRRHHFLAALAVERAGRLVGQNDLAAVHQRAGDRHALLLAAGELTGAMMRSVPHAQTVEQRYRALAPEACSLPGIDGRHLDIAGSGQIRQQLIPLKNKPEMLSAQSRQRIAVKCARIIARNLVRAVGRLVEQAEDVHQRRLARARRADDRNHLSAI